MIDGFFFYRVDVYGTGRFVDKSIKRSVFRFSDFAKTPLSVSEHALVRAEDTFYGRTIKFFVVESFFRITDRGKSITLGGITDKTSR